MPYTAQQLITNSWYLSGIVARNLQVPTGDQIGNGLDMLNDLLNFKQIETDLIPYWQYITFPAVPGQEYYFLSGVAAVEEMTFNLGVVRYPMVGVTRTNYYGSSRVDNISTLPFSWNYDRALDGGNLALYFIPDQAYPLKMKAKLFFTDVSLNTDLTDITTHNGLTINFVATQFTTPFTVTSGTGSALVINTSQSMAFGEQIQFTGGSIPSTLSLSTTYYAVPINQGTFYVATTLANAQQGIYVAYAAGTGDVTAFSLVITLGTPTTMSVGSEIIFNEGTGTLPPGLTAGVVYYANPSSSTTFCVATSLANAEAGDNIPYTGAGIPTNSVTFINQDNTPYYTNYTFINSSNQGYDTSYIEMLRYALARYMASEYGVIFNPQSEAIYQSYVRKLMYMSPPDLSMKKVTILSASDQVGYNWGDVSIGRGWRPS